MRNMKNLLHAELWHLAGRPLTSIVLLYAFGSGFIGGCDLNRFGMDNVYLFGNYVLITIAIVWSVGQKHEEHGFVNEITVGHSRLCIVLSQVLLQGAFAAATMLMFSLGCAVGGAQYFAGLPASTWLAISLGSILACAFYATLITVIACLIPSRAVSAVVCLAVFLALFGGGYEIHHLLELDRWQDPTGFRAFCKPFCVALDFGTPFGQIEYHRAYLVHGMNAHDTLDAVRSESVHLYSLLASVLAMAEAALTAAVGVMLFRRKDLI